MKKNARIQKRYNVHFGIDTYKFRIWKALNCKNLEEVGEFMDQLSERAMAGDFEYLKQLPFIVGRIYVGTAKRPSIPPSVRKRVLSAGECAQCGSKENLTVDHIVPFSKGGAHDESNFQCLCWKCNRAKWDK